MIDKLMKKGDPIARRYKTLDQIKKMEMPDTYDNPAYEDSNELDGSCAFDYISGLKDVSPQMQALGILAALGTSERKVKTSKKGILSRQVIFTDTITNGSVWAEAKAIAYKGPITVNTNSGNKVQLYIITESEVEALYNS